MNEDFQQRTLAGLGTLGMLVFCLGPFVYMILVSLAGHPSALAGASPFSPTLAHYREILTTPSLHFLDYLQNSLIVSAASAAAAVLVASLAAYAVTRLALPGRLALLLFVLALSMFPQISIVGYLYRLLGSLGWINTRIGLILPYTAWILPLSLWILVSYFAQLPRDLDRAARIDGCTDWQVLRRVIFPVAAPGIFSTALLAFIFAFNEFLFALMLTTDHQARTIPVGIALFQGLHGQVPWGAIMAVSALTTLPVVVLALLFQRRIIEGLTRGAVKG